MAIKNHDKTDEQISEAEKQKLIHELEVNQIELKLQNEELIQAKASETLTAEKYLNLYDFAPSGYYSLSADGCILELNIAGAALLGKERSYLKNKRFALYIRDESKTVFNQFLEKVFNSGTQEICDITLSKSIETLLYVHITGIASENKEQILLTAVDITERKIAEETLSKTISLQKATLESTTDGILVVDLQGKIVDYNKMFLELWGISKSIISEGKTKDLVAPENAEFAVKHIMEQLSDPQQFVSKVQELYNKPEADSFDVLHFTDGRIIERFSKPQYINDSPVGRVWSFHEVTAFRKAQLDLQESEERYRILVENVSAGIGYYDLEGNVILFNKLAAADMNGVPEDFIGKSIFEIFGEERGKFYFDRIQNTAKADKFLEFEDEVKLPTMTKWFVSRNNKVYNPDGAVIGVQVISHDITELKIAEQNISLSNTRYKSLFNDSPIPLWEEDLTDAVFYLLGLKEKGHKDLHNYFDDNPNELMKCVRMIKILDVNQAALDLHLADNKEHLIGNLSEIFTENSLTVFKEELIDVVEGKEKYESEAEVKTLSGDLKNIYITLKIDKSQPDKVKVLLATSDITERKQAEEKLKESEAKYKGLVETASDAIYLFSENGTIIDTNQCACDMLGKSRDEIVGSIIETVDPKFPKVEFLKFWKNIPFNKQLIFESTHLHKDGTEIPVEVSGNKHVLDEKLFYYGIARDITERKQSEEQLKQQSLDLIFLNSMAISLADKPDDSGFSKTLLKGVQDHTNAVAAVFSLYDRDEKALITKHFEAEKSVTQKIIKIAGEKIISIASPVNDEAYALITKSTIGICDNFVDITFGAVPKSVDKAIRAATGISSIYAIGHFIDGQLYGTSTLSFKKSQAKPSMEMLESYAHLMAVYKRNSSVAKELKESETRFKALHNASFGGIAIHDKGLILDCNKGLSEISGYEIDELIRMDGMRLIAEESREMVMGNILAEYEKPYRATGIKKNGEKYPLRLLAKNIPYKGNVARVVEFRDTTEQKQADENLLSALSRNEAILDAVPDIIMEVDVNKVYTWANKEGADFFGNDVIGKEASHYFEGEQTTYKQVEPLFKNVNNIIYVESWQRRKDGEKRLLAWQCRRLEDKEGNATGLISSALDMTERNKVEEELKESELKFRALFEQAGGYCMILDPNTPDGIPVIVDANEAACSNHGYTKDELIGRPVSDIDDDEGKQLITERTVGIMTGKPFYMENVHIRKDGTTFKVAINAKRIDVGDGHPLIFTTEYDITDRVEAEEALTKSEERFNLAMAAAKDGLYDWDLVTNEIYYSPGWKSMLGYNDDELSNDFSIWEKLTDAENVKKSWEMQQEMINKQRNRFEMEFKMKHKDGHWIDILSRAEAMFDENDKAIRIVGTHVDITERKIVEQKIIILNQELEQKVIERTKNLKNKNAELSRINNLFVGRELRMVELKKMISELKERLASK